MVFVFVATPIFAQPPQGRGGPPQDRGGPPGGFGGSERELLDQFDANKDGWLNQEERAEAREFIKENPAPSRFGRGGPGGRRGRGGRGEPGSGRGEPGSGRGGDGPPRGGFGPPPGGGPPPGRAGRRGRGRGGVGGGNRPPTKPGEKIAVADVDPIDAELYDPSVLRTVFIQFENDDWESELEAFHGTDVEVPATLTVDGKEYPLCGIHFRGMSSYMMVPAGHKRSFNIALDLVDDKQRLYGSKTLNLLNGNGDDTMMSTVLYSHLSGKHAPTPKANLVRVVVNGENWGVYTNVQQFNKEFLREHYPSAKGTRWKVSGSPRGGGGLDYRGQDLAKYGHPYEMKDGDDEALAKMVELCRVMDEVPADELEEALKGLLNVEELLWFLAYDNGLCNSDGYWTRASDYSIFMEESGMFHIIPHDMNEAFRHAGGGGFRFGPPPTEPESASKGLDPLIGMDDASKPLRSKILAVPAFRKQYMANIRTIADELDWENLGPVVAQFRELIKDDMERDTRKLATYESFLEMTSDSAPAAEDDSESEAEPRRRGPGGHSAMNLRKFSEERSQFLRDAASGTATSDEKTNGTKRGK